MTVIVNSGTTLTIGSLNGLTLTADSTILAGGELQGVGLISGAFNLVNLGLILTDANAALDADTDLDIGTSSLINQGTVEVERGTITLPSTVSGSGTIQVDTNGTLIMGAGTYTQTFTDNGVISASGGAIINGGIGGTGTLSIGAGGVELASSFSGAVIPGGELILDSPSSFTGTINSPFSGDIIVLKGIVGNAATPGSLAQNVNTFTITNNGVPIDTLTIDAVQMIRQITTYSLNVAPDTVNNNTTITISTSSTCFRTGTHVATPAAEVLVEALVVGDQVMSHFGAEHRIAWIGHRTIDCRRQPNPSLVWPVRVAAHAFGPGEPYRDLFLSPDHAVFVDGALIPIKYLINGKTVVQIAVDDVTYFHIELAEHDILLAEGLAVESYLDIGDRALFANGGPTVALFPEFTARTWETRGCAPLLIAGGKVNRLREVLAERADVIADRAASAVS